MAELAVAAQIIGTVISAVSGLRQGQAQEQRANYEAQQLAANATAERAAGQRAGIEQKRQAGLAESRAVALTAAGGGSLLDPTAIDILGGIEAEGDYRAGVENFESESRAQSYESGANIKRWEGKQAARAGKYQAVSTLLSGAGSAGESLFDKYSSPSDSSSSGAINAGGWGSTTPSYLGT